MNKLKQTIAYYDQNAKSYFDLTVGVDVSEIRQVLTNKVAAPAHILDAGCGSGRDTKVFLEQGYTVTAIDASSQLAALASEYTGIAVKTCQFSDLTYSAEFDAVFANASLLHLDNLRLVEGFKKLFTALKPQGYLVATFKKGFEAYVDEATKRFFNQMTAQRLELEVKNVAECNVEIIEVPDKMGRNQDWLILVAQKIA